MSALQSASTVSLFFQIMLNMHPHIEMLLSGIYVVTAISLMVLAFPTWTDTGIGINVCNRHMNKIKKLGH